jgi:transcriptional regulator with XRE-family HTH domain
VLLREARRRHHVTQKQLAARARTSQAQISRIERDLVSPSVATLANLLHALGEELELNATSIDYGFDRTLYDVTLSLTPVERIEASARFGERIRDIHEAVRVRTDSTPPAVSRR